MTNQLSPIEQQPVQQDWIDTKFGQTVAGGVMFAEVTPINEAVRGVVAGLAIAKGFDPAAVAATYAAATYAIETPAAALAARYLHSKSGKAKIEGINDKIEHSLFKHLLNTNIVSEAGIGMAMGAATATAIKHRQDPERTLEQDKRYGLGMSIGVTALCGAQGYAMAKGIDYLDIKYAGAALVAGVGSWGLFKWVKDRMTGNSQIERAEKMISGYTDLLEMAAPSRQIEGLEPEAILAAAEDERTLFITKTNSNGENVRIPLAVPLEYAKWLNTDFFAKNGYDVANMLYCVLPQDVLSTLPPDELLAAMQTSQAEQSIVIDYPEEKTPVYHTFTPDTYRVDELMTPSKTPAATYHYKTICDPTEAAANYVTDPNVHHLDKDDLDVHFERIWDIYSAQFQGLVDEHPINGALSKDELRQSLYADSTRASAYMQDGKVMAFGQVIDDIRACPWLNADYFRQEADGLPLVYLPGVATAKEAPAVSGKIMMHLMKERFDMCGKFMLTFECSNKSARYIPLIVKRSLSQSGIVQPFEFEQSRVLYQVMTTGK